MVSDKFQRQFTTLVCGLYLIVFMHLYQPNMGGEGLRLPVNIVGWMGISAAIFIQLILSLTSRTFIASRSLYIFSLAAIVLAVPLLYPDSRWVNSIVRVVGLVGGVIFYAALQQNNLLKKNKNTFLLLILISSIVEMCIALLQFFFFEPDNWMEFVPGNRAYGIFQQINVLASYLATGAGIAAWFYYQQTDIPNKKWLNQLTNLALLICISLFSFVLVLLSSRIGYLGGVAVLITLVGCFGKQRPARTLLIFAFVATGGLVAQFSLPISWLQSLTHEASNTHRIMMLEQSFSMIAAKPWLGWGYGNFEYSFLHFVGDKYPLVINESIVKHPHNELLYWWVEGGIVALAGMVLVGVGYLMTLFTHFNRARLAVWGLTLPIALHTMTEYPLYQSVPHFMVLIILLALVDSHRNHRTFPLRNHSWKLIGLHTCLVLAFLFSQVFLFTGLQTNKTLTQFERSGMMDFTRADMLINPWIQWQRYEFDRHTNQLMLFNQKRDVSYLYSYEEWAARYSQVNVDPSVYMARIQIARAMNDKEKAEQLVNEAKRIIPATFKN